MPKKQRPKRPDTIPSDSEILQFIATSPGHVGKRDIARAFGLKGQSKIALKQMLKRLEQDGTWFRGRKKSIDAERLPSVAVVEIIRVDAAGDAIAKFVDWNIAARGTSPELLLVAGIGKAPGLGDRVLARIEAAPLQSGFAYVARVMRDVSHDAPKIVGVFRKMASGGRIVSAGKKDRDELVVQRGDDAGTKDGELVVAEVLRHKGRGLAQARVRHRLGSADDPRNTSLIAIESHGIPHAFSTKVLAEVARLKPFNLAQREDLRHIPFLTIDPVDARDHDDAIWARPDDNPQNQGGHVLVIAIADVATYVRPGSSLDREARLRGNSVYFPDRVVPMLPEPISNDLCSLKEGEDRPALVCTITVSREGEKLAHKFSRAVIRVKAGVTYEAAQAAIDGRKSPVSREVLEDGLKPLWRAYAALCKARSKRAPLDLDLPERRIRLNSEGKVEGIEIPERLDAHRLVEEFMILANVAAAEALRKKRIPFLYRVHEQPAQEKLKALSDFLQTINVPFSPGQVIKPKIFNRLLEVAKDTPHHRLVNEVVLRSQAQASYSPQNRGHFGLALANYAHFTSPIRRYADLIVHRALISAFELGEDGLSTQDIAQLEDTGELISTAERRAMAAERDTIDRMIALHLKDHLGARFAARISGVVGAGLFVTLKENGADGFVPVAKLGHGYFAFDQSRHALVNAATGETFQLGDDVEVRLMEVAPIRGGLRFDVLSDGKPGPKPNKPFRRGRRR